MPFVAVAVPALGVASGIAALLGLAIELAPAPQLPYAFAAVDVLSPAERTCCCGLLWKLPYHARAVLQCRAFQEIVLEPFLHFVPG